MAQQEVAPTVTAHCIAAAAQHPARLCTQFRMGQEVGHLKMALATAKEVEYGAVVRPSHLTCFAHRASPLTCSSARQRAFLFFSLALCLSALWALSRQTLELDGKMMFDPLSLNDFEAIRGATEATIHVKVGQRHGGQG